MNYANSESKGDTMPGPKPPEIELSDEERPLTLQAPSDARLPETKATRKPRYFVKARIALIADEVASFIKIQT